MIFIKSLLVLYACTLFVSFGVLLVCCIYLFFSKKRLEQLTLNYGIKSYFTDHLGGIKSYLSLFIPVVNMLIASALLLTVFTDWGDDN